MKNLLLFAALVAFGSAAPTGQKHAIEVTDAQCCWSKWGTTCSGYPASGKGGLCSTDWSKTCTSPGDCPTTPVPPPAPPTPPGPPGPSPPPPPVPPHPPAPPTPPLPAKTSPELLGWLENWGPDVSWWDTQMPDNCLMGCWKAAPLLKQTADYSSFNYGFIFLTQDPNPAQVGCGTTAPQGPCPAWDGQNIYIAAATKQGSVAVNAQTNINTVSPGILSIADAVRLGKMHPSGPKRVKITLGGWSDYARIGTAQNGVKAANLMAKLVAFTFADGVDMDLEHLTPFSGMDDEYGGLIAFITQLRNQLDLVSKNWAKTANARATNLQKQFKAACPSYKHCTAHTKRWWQTNILHMKEIAKLPAPHLEISWTTRFNAFVPSDDPLNYLTPDSAQPDKLFRFPTDNEGLNFWPQVAHLVDTVNIMAYDEGSIKHGNASLPLKLNFTTILSNFVRYGNVSASKINLGFEPGPQADHGKWEGEEVDVSVAKEIAQNKLGGGVAIWAVNPTPKKTNNASQLCASAAKALSPIMNAKYAYGKAPNYTRCDANGLWPAGNEEE